MFEACHGLTDRSTLLFNFFSYGLNDCFTFRNTYPPRLSPHPSLLQNQRYLLAMANKFRELAFTDSVRKTQAHYFGRAQPVQASNGPDALTDEEIEFIRARDSFYIATVSETGWPYVQHRGGKPGFLRVLSPGSLAFADYKGNRQMLSTGNLAINDRVCLFFMDYPQQTRLKILGHARVEDARGHPELVAQLAEPEVQRIVERLFFIDVVSFDWNCQKYITPRYTAAEIAAAVEPLRQRITELEAEIKNRN
jgi:predicted pyridoxine 5'-phosphate oxidase superfamily flavin-nucleotide-binding protein